jgi:hypothetical protein
MKAIAKYLPKTRNEFIMFFMIVGSVLFAPLVANMIQLELKLNQLNKEFFGSNPEMKQIVANFENCSIENNNEHSMNKKCLNEFRKSTNDEQNYKLAEYYGKKKAILLQAKANLN